MKDKDEWKIQVGILSATDELTLLAEPVPPWLATSGKHASKNNVTPAILSCDFVSQPYLTSVSHLGWPSRAMRLGGLGLNRTSP